MKKLILIILICPFYLLGQTKNPDNVITVIGYSEIEIEPDIIILQLTANETENPKKESEIISMEKNIKSFITSVGIKQESFSIINYYAFDQYKISSSNNKYRINKTYQLTINKGILLDTIIAKCFEYGINRVNILKVNHSKMDSIKQVLLVNAIQSANGKAELTAKTLHLTLGKLYSMNENYQIVNNQKTDYDYNENFLMKDISLTGYASGIEQKNRYNSNLSLEKMKISKSIILKYEIQ